MKQIYKIYNILFINLGENEIRSEIYINVATKVWKFSVLYNKYYLKQ